MSKGGYAQLFGSYFQCNHDTSELAKKHTSENCTSQGSPPPVCLRLWIAAGIFSLATAAAACSPYLHSLSITLPRSSDGVIGPLERRLEVKTKEDADIVVHRLRSLVGENWRRSYQGRSVRSSNSSNRNLTAHEQVECAFDIEEILDATFSSVLNIKSAVNTCGHDVPLPSNLKSEVCAINIETAALSIANLASSLADAIATCAPPNIDALCATSVIGMLQALAGIAAGSQIISSACNMVAQQEEHRFHQILDSGGTHEHHVGRRLYLGGGRGTATAQCVNDYLQEIPTLGQLGLAIDAATSACPAKTLEQMVGERRLGSIFTGTALSDLAEHFERIVAAFSEQGGITPAEIASRVSELSGEAHDLSIANCQTTISSIITEFFKALSFFAISAVHCLHKLNTRAICTAGVGVLVAALSGVGQSAGGIYLACDAAQKLASSIDKNAIFDAVHERSILDEAWNSSSRSGGFTANTNPSDLSDLNPKDRKSVV